MFTKFSGQITLQFSWIYELIDCLLRCNPQVFKPSHSLWLFQRMQSKQHELAIGSLFSCCGSHYGWRVLTCSNSCPAVGSGAKSNWVRCNGLWGARTVLRNMWLRLLHLFNHCLLYPLSTLLGLFDKSEKESNNNENVVVKKNGGNLAGNG